MSIKERAKILHCLVEGNSIRGTARLCDKSVNTVMKLQRETGLSCEVMHYTFLNQRTELSNVQADELTSYVRSKQRKCYGSGMFYTWIAIHPTTKVVVAWHTGRRSGKDGAAFLGMVRAAVGDNVKMATDAYRAYQDETENVFGAGAKHTVILKGQFLKKNDVHTSFVERMNLSVRRGVSRFARKTNAFSKSITAHRTALSLYFAHYNFCRIHGSLRVTPAMEAGLTDRVWSLEDIAALA